MESGNIPRLLEDIEINEVIHHDFIEVETIPFDGKNVGMTVHIAATDFLFSENAYEDLVVRLEFYDVLLG